MIQPSDFQNRTREQWREFDNYRAITFQPTPEEIAQQEAERIANMINITKEKLQTYGISFIGTETDFSELYTEYIKGIPAMNEWLGDDNRLNQIVADKIANCNNLECFCSFVLQYE